MICSYNSLVVIQLILQCTLRVYYENTEFISKNNQHRQYYLFQKITCVNGQPGSGSCVVHLLDWYILKLPEIPPVFYLDKVPSSNRPWYCKNKVGINKLKTFIPEICS